MATLDLTAPALAGERSRSATAALYVRPVSLRFLEAVGELGATILILCGGLMAYGHLVA